MNIEIELDVIKRLLASAPDVSVDEKNWDMVKKTVRRQRKSNYRATYGSR